MEENNCKFNLPIFHFFNKIAKIKAPLDFLKEILDQTNQHIKDKGK